MGEGDHALGFGETEGVGVGAIVVSMVVSLAIVTVFTSGAVPHSVFGLELFAEATAVGEWEGFIGAAGRGIVIMVLGHGEPPEVVLMSILHSRGQGYTPSVHGFRSIMVRDEGAVIKVRVNARDHPSFGEASPSFGVLGSPAHSFVS